MINLSSKFKQVKGNIYLSVGKHKEEYTWHYVEVDKIKAPLFLNDARSKPSIDVADYGKILFSGWGKEPPEDIKKKIEDML